MQADVSRGADVKTLVAEISRRLAIAELSRKVQVPGDDGLDPEFPQRYTSIIEVDARGEFAVRVPAAPMRYTVGVVAPGLPSNTGVSSGFATSASTSAGPYSRWLEGATRPPKAWVSACIP